MLREVRWTEVDISDGHGVSLVWKRKVLTQQLKRQSRIAIISTVMIHGYTKY